MNTTPIKCEICGNYFDKSSREVRRSIKKGKPSICQNKNCKSEWGRITIKRRKNHNGGMNADWMRKINPSKRNELSPFRSLLRKTRSRKTKQVGSDVSITVEQLKELWEKQNGICVITGLKMILPKTTAETNVGPKCASIDRIDNSKGYSIDNIQLVCYSANLARNIFDMSVIKQFFDEIK